MQFIEILFMMVPQELIGLARALCTNLHLKAFVQKGRRSICSADQYKMMLFMSKEVRLPKISLILQEM